MTSKAQRLSGLAKELDALAAASSSTLIVYEYTATAGQTVFSGADNNGLTLNYIPGNTLVVYNEGVLQKTVDYATTSASVLTLTSGAEVGALVRMYAFGTFAVANVYTKPESDTIITNLALKSASKADILGTVSQAAGVPTGAIMETGTNANGRYIKYADGTMICTHTYDAAAMAITSAVGSIFQAGSEITWTYPVAFVGIPTPNLNVYRNDGTVIVGIFTRVVTNANLQWRLWSAPSLAGGNSKDVTLCAIGRWF
jgi:hypothetical protein